MATFIQDCYRVRSRQARAVTQLRGFPFIKSLFTTNCLLRTAVVTTMPRKTCSHCKQVRSGVKLCADDLLCSECETANANKLAELPTKTTLPTTAAVQEPLAVVAEATNRSCSSNSKINRPKQKNPKKLSSDDTDMDLSSGFAAKSAAAVNCDVCDVETSSHQQNKQQRTNSNRAVPLYLQLHLLACRWSLSWHHCVLKFNGSRPQ